MSDRRWVDVPTIVGAPVNTRKVTGTVDLTFNGGGRVHASTNNVSPVLFRDKLYSVSVHYVRAEDGSFGPGDYTTVRLVIAGFTAPEAPRTIKAAIVAAVADTVEASWTVARDDLARQVRASQHLGQLENEHRAAQRRVAELEAEMLPLRRLLGEA